MKSSIAGIEYPGENEGSDGAEQRELKSADMT